MSDSLSADTTEPSTGVTASDATPPDLDSGETGGQDPERGDVFASYDVTVEQTLVEDKETGVEVVQWRASCEGEHALSDDPMAAVMATLESVTGGKSL